MLGSERLHAFGQPFCAPKVPPRGREIDVRMYVRIVERNHQVDRRSQVQVSSLDKNSSLCLFFDKTPSILNFIKKTNLSIYGPKSMTPNQKVQFRGV